MLLIGLVSSLNAGVAFSKDIKYRGFKIVLTSDKPITSGSNELKLKITKNNKIISLKEVSVKAFMPAMPGMPAMESKNVATKLSEDTYSTKLNFAMSGTWQIHIFLKPETGKKTRIKSSLNI